jgi:hypothetical protein
MAIFFIASTSFHLILHDFKLKKGALIFSKISVPRRSAILPLLPCGYPPNPSVTKDCYQRIYYSIFLFFCQGLCRVFLTIFKEKGRKKAIFLFRLPFARFYG